jgi:hypothetical protein
LKPCGSAGATALLALTEEPLSVEVFVAAARAAGTSLRGQIGPLSRTAEWAHALGVSVRKLERRCAEE